MRSKIVFEWNIAKQKCVLVNLGLGPAISNRGGNHLSQGPDEKTKGFHEWLKTIDEIASKLYQMLVRRLVVNRLALL